MQRLRVGITGLAAVVLIVLLATAIASGVRRSAGAQNAAIVVSVPSPTPGNGVDQKAEPLAQLGVAPGGTTDKAPGSKPKR